MLGITLHSTSDGTTTTIYINGKQSGYYWHTTHFSTYQRLYPLATGVLDVVEQGVRFSVADNTIIGPCRLFGIVA